MASKLTQHLFLAGVNLAHVQPARSSAQKLGNRFARIAADVAVEIVFAQLDARFRQHATIGREMQRHRVDQRAVEVEQRRRDVPLAQRVLNRLRHDHGSFSAAGCAALGSHCRFTCPRT